MNGDQDGLKSGGEKIEMATGLEKEEVVQKIPTRSGISMKPGKRGLFAGLTIGVVVLMAIISVLIILKPWETTEPDCNGATNCGVSDHEEEDDLEGLPNSDLKAGTVSVAIDGKTIEYAGAYVVDGISAAIGSGTYESATDDQAVFLVVNGGSLTVQGDVTIKKTGSADFSGRGDAYSFYGINSAIVVVGEKSSVSINGATITTNVSGANAVVATGGGTGVVKNTIITTSSDNSRGLHATYGGMINADGVSISTKGGSSASLATDRGSGTVVATNMKLETAGAGSPLVYSTGEITVTNSAGTAAGAQIAVVEGENSIDLQGCEFSANGAGNRGSVDNAGVMIYQSMSGDASIGTGSFTATDSTLTVLDTSSVYNKTPFFFVTNTTATIDLTGVTISFSPEQKLISALGTTEWGKSGSNGGHVTITMNDTKATNTEVEVDSASSVTGL